MGRNQLRYSGFLANFWGKGGRKVINNLPVFGGIGQPFVSNKGETESQYGRNWVAKTGEIGWVKSPIFLGNFACFGAIDLLTRVSSVDDVSPFCYTCSVSGRKNVALPQFSVLCSSPGLAPSAQDRRSPCWLEWRRRGFLAWKLPMLSVNNESILNLSIIYLSDGRLPISSILSFFTKDINFQDEKMLLTCLFI